MDGRELTAAKHTLTILRGTQLPFPFPSPLHRYDLMILKAADLKGETDFPLYCKQNSETTAKYKPMGKVLDPNCDAVLEEKKQVRLQSSVAQRSVANMHPCHGR